MATNTFNFQSYNDLMKDANSGLRLYLALQSLQEVEATFRRFKSPFARELADIVDEVADIRERNKKYLENREKTTPANIDDGSDMTKVSTSADTGKVTA